MTTDAAVRRATGVHRNPVNHPEMVDHFHPGKSTRIPGR